MASLSCKRCGAPLTVDPESLITVCDYCGFPNVIGGDFSSEQVYVVPSQPREAVVNRFMEVARSDPQLSRFSDVEILEVSGAYFPAWYATLKASVTASWYTTVWEQRGKTMVSRRVLHQDKRVYSRRVFLPAKRRIPSEPIRDVLASYTVKTGKVVTLSQEDFDWEKIKLEFLGVEIGRLEALRIMADKFVDALRDEYRGRGESLDFFSAQITDTLDLTLLYVPVWTVSYVVNDSVYTAIFDGNDLSCVYRSEPLTSTERIMRFSMGIMLSLISGPLFAATATLAGFESSLLFLGMLGLAGYSITKSSIESARVEKA